MSQKTIRKDGFFERCTPPAQEKKREIFLLSRKRSFPRQRKDRLFRCKCLPNISNFYAGLSISLIVDASVFLTLQTNAMTHPIKVQPRNKFNSNTAVLFKCFFANATIVGRKYTNKPSVTHMMMIAVKVVFPTPPAASAAAAPASSAAKANIIFNILPPLHKIKSVRNRSHVHRKTRNFVLLPHKIPTPHRRCEKRSPHFYRSKNTTPAKCRIEFCVVALV